MISFEMADQAAEVLTRELEDKPWLNGVAVEKDELGQYLVSIRVDSDTPLEQAQAEAHIPTEYDGVRILLKHQEIARAFRFSSRRGW